MKTTVPATFKAAEEAAVLPLCGARRPGWDQGPAIGSHRIPCLLPADHDNDHRDGLGNTWEPAPASPTATDDLFAVWQSMTLGEAASTPVAQLLTLLGVRLVEVEPEDLPAETTAEFNGRIGDAEIRVSRLLPQAEREQTVRGFLNGISPDHRTTVERGSSARPIKAFTGKVRCYDWCTEDHDGDPTMRVEDITHTSDSADLDLPQPNELTFPLLHAQISVDPFSPDADLRVPHMLIDDESGLYPVSLLESLQLADRITAFAEEIRAMAQRAAQ